MCRRVDCSRCGKPTFAGCGLHVEQVLGDVPRAKRCACNGARPAGGEALPKTGAGWLSAILGGGK